MIQRAYIHVAGQGQATFIKGLLMRSDAQAARCIHDDGAFSKSDRGAPSSPEGQFAYRASIGYNCTHNGLDIQ